VLFSQNPALTNQQVKDLITINVDPYAAYYSGGDIQPRAGRINVYTALLAVKNGTPQPPPEPVNLTATAGNTTVSLAWDASPGAASYNVYRAAAPGGPYDAPVSTTATTFTDGGLTNCTTYYYAVSAVNGTGESGNSFETSTTPNDPAAVPTPPTGLTAYAGDASVSLYWTGNGCAASYNVYRSTTSGGPYSSVGSTSGTSFYDTGVTNGTTYYYVVRGMNAKGESVNSNEATATPQLAPPYPPYNLIATGFDMSVSLRWTGRANATSYDVYRGTKSGGPYHLAGSASGTSFSDTGLTNGKTYYYVVTALNAAGESGYSNQASAAPTLLPAAPSGLMVTKIFRTELDLAWTDNSNNETGFVVQISTDGAQFSDYLSPVGPNVTKFAATGLVRGTTYYFRVRASGVAGDSGYSNVVSGTTKG